MKKACPELTVIGRQKAISLSGASLSIPSVLLPHTLLVECTPPGAHLGPAAWARAELGFHLRLCDFIYKLHCSSTLWALLSGMHRVGHLCSYLNLNGWHGNSSLKFHQLIYILHKVLVLSSGLDSFKLCQVLLQDRTRSVYCTASRDLFVLPH